MNLSDNWTHLIGLVAVLACGTLLIIFAHSFIDPAYVFGTCFTVAGAIFGYKFGSGSSTTATEPTAPTAPTAPVTQPAQPPMAG